MEVTDEMRKGSEVIANFMMDLDNPPKVPEFDSYTNFELLQEIVNEK